MGGGRSPMGWNLNHPSSYSATERSRTSNGEKELLPHAEHGKEVAKWVNFA